jgi:hypothetical protein
MSMNTVCAKNVKTAEKEQRRNKCEPRETEK